MYGLIIEGICDYIKERYGEEQWLLIREKAGLQNFAFSTHKLYSEKHVPRIAAATSEVTKTEKTALMNSFGVSFVGFVGKYGYDRILRVLGRHMRDFLNGLDNLHEYLRFSYPKIKPPSFYATEETRHGLTLHYRSKRKGFLHYCIGQLKQVGKRFYDLDIQVEVISEEITRANTFHAIFRLYFDNIVFRNHLGSNFRIRENWQIKSDDFFDMFPFCLVFDPDMIIKHSGPKISAVLPNLVDVKLSDAFTLIRPLMNFTWDDIIVHTNNIFELASVDRVCVNNFKFREISGSNSKANHPESKDSKTHQTPSKGTKPKIDDNQELKAFEAITEKDDTKGYGSEDENNPRPRRLFLRGQVKYMASWNCMIYLCNPLMPNLDAMFRTGLYINDLSMHDSSVDLVLAGSQQSVELKLALDQEQRKSAKLEESMKKLDIEMKRTDSLLYQMIPRQVAERLRRGEPALSTCEVFKDVTILFSDVVGFTQICSVITPMAVVSMLNAMYSKFDKLTEQHKVYKVETIGDAYMVVAGAPTKTKYHAEHICDMALDMVLCMMGLQDPSSGDNMKIRIGLHSGMVVAGVVGLKMPRYCLFGDTVNTASRMETSGETMKIHMSQATKDYLEQAPYVTVCRGTLDVKGKGNMNTYWLEGKRRKSMGNIDIHVSPDWGDKHEVIKIKGPTVKEFPKEKVDDEEYKKDFPMSAVQRRSDVHLPISSIEDFCSMNRDFTRLMADTPDEFRQRSSSANSWTMASTRPKTEAETKSPKRRRSSVASFRSAYTPVSFSDVESLSEQGPTMLELEELAQNQRDRELHRGRSVQRSHSSSQIDDEGVRQTFCDLDYITQKNHLVDMKSLQSSSKTYGGDHQPGPSKNDDDDDDEVVRSVVANGEHNKQTDSEAVLSSVTNVNDVAPNKTGGKSKVDRGELNGNIDNHHHGYKEPVTDIMTQSEEDTRRLTPRSATCSLL